VGERKKRVECRLHKSGGSGKAEPAQTTPESPDWGARRSKGPSGSEM